MYLSIFSKWFGKKPNPPASTKQETEQPKESVASLVSPEQESSASQEEETPINPEEIYVPRVLYYKTFGATPGNCPRCKSDVENHSVTFLVVVQSQSEEEHLLVGSSLIWFCHRCPTAVINPDKLYATLREIQAKKGLEGFHLVGLVANSDKDLSEKELGSDDNPINLIPFTEHKTFGKGSKRIKTPGAKSSHRK